jgi:predicted transcriptional regulator
MATIVEQLLVHKGRNVWSVSPTATVRDAVALLGEQEIGAVFVCDGQRVVGVLSERDCMRKLLWEGKSTLDSSVRDVMRAEFSTVAPRDSIQHCMSLMNDRRTRHLPVVEQGRVIGVISMGDVINGLLREQQYLIESLEGYISGSPSVRPSAH